MSSRLVLVALLLPLLAVAAPVPKRKPKFGDFGDFTDPKTKCKAEVSGAELTITVPTDQPAVDSNEVGPHQPLIAKTVEGDFTLTVRMTQTLPDNPGRASPKIREAAASGLAVASDSDPELCVSSVILRKDWGGKGWDTYQLTGWNVPKLATGRMETGARAVAGQPVYLRVFRRGDEVTFEESRNGKNWWPMGHHELGGHKGALRVGPVAFQSTDQEFTTTFDEYELKHVAKDEKK